LGDIVAAISLGIEVEEHSTLQKPQAMSSPFYQKYREVFFKVPGMNPDIGFLYTLRQSEKGEKITD